MIYLYINWKTQTQTDWKSWHALKFKSKYTNNVDPANVSITVDILVQFSILYEFCTEVWVFLDWLYVSFPELCL